MAAAATDDAGDDVDPAGAVSARLGTLGRHEVEDGRMPLSDHEKQLFAEIERGLAADDPRFFVRSRRRLAAWSPEFRLRAAVLMAVLGVMGVFGLTFDLLFGIVGMGLLLTAIFVGASATSDRARAAQQGLPQDRA